jgi:hypothetical protein
MDKLAQLKTFQQAPRGSSPQTSNDPHEIGPDELLKSVAWFLRADRPRLRRYQTRYRRLCVDLLSEIERGSYSHGNHGAA